MANVPYFNDELRKYLQSMQDIFDSNIIPACCKVKYLVKREYFDWKESGDKTKNCYDIIYDLSEKYCISEATARHYIWNCKNIYIGKPEEELIKRKKKIKKIMGCRQIKQRDVLRCNGLDGVRRCPSGFVRPS